MRLDAAVVDSQTLAWSARVSALRKEGRPVISLGLGEPDFPTPPHVVEAAYKALKDGFTTYSGAPGLDELRAAVARKLRAENGIPAEPGEIVVTPGAKNALFLAAAALLEPGDEAVNLSPCYVSNVPILKLAEPSCRVVDVPLTGPRFGLDAERLRAAVNGRTRLLLINYPNNPTGRMLERPEADLLVELLREHKGLHLISDEIYERLALGGLPHFSPASVEDVRDRVITVNGFSKAYAMTGWRIGYAHAPRRLAQRILKIHSQLNTHTATFVQKAALAALEGPQDHLASFVDRLRQRRSDLERFLAGCPSARSTPPDGGFFAFIEVPEQAGGSDAFCTALLERTGVAVLPGVSFGAAFDRHFRVSLAVPGDDFRRALERIGAHLSGAAA